MMLKKKNIRNQGTRSRARAVNPVEAADRVFWAGEEGFRNLFVHHLSAMLLIDVATGAILDANQAAAEFYGWPISRLKQMAYQQLNTLPPEALMAAMNQAATEACNRFEFCHRRADDSIREVEVFSSRIEFAGKDILYSIIHDITERKQAEKLLREREAAHREQEVLRQSEDRFCELLENAQDAAYKRNLQTDVYEYLSPVFTRISGYRPEESMGWSTESIIQYIHPDDQMHVRRLWIGILFDSNTTACRLEYRFRHKEGRYIWLLDRFTAFFDPMGVPLMRIGSVSDISARKRAEEALRYERQQMESIIDGTRIGTWEWNVQTGEVIVNKRWAEMLGYTLAELDTTSVMIWKTLVYPDDQKRPIALLERHLDGELPHYECEYRMRHKDGNWIWVLSSGRLLTCTQEGDPLMMYGAHLDITKRKQVEEILEKSHEQLELRVRERTADLFAANVSLRREMEERKRIEAVLRENEERYRRITEGLTDFIYFVKIQDGEATMTVRNPTCLAVTGYSSKEFAVDPSLWMRMIDAEDRHLVIASVKQALGKIPEPSPVEYRIRRKDGRVRWVSDKLIAQYDAQGTIVAYDGVVNDITERKRAEQQLAHSKATLALAIDGMPDPLILLDPEMRVLRLNRPAKRYYGLEGYEKAIGRQCYEAFMNRSLPCNGCRQPFSSMHGFSGVFERQGAIDSSRLEQVVVDKVVGASGRTEAYIVRIFDITEERKMDRQLIQSEKLASLGLLIAGIAHEINNPNNFIFFNTPILRSYLQFLLPIVDEYVATRPDMQVFNRPYPVFREDCFKLLDNIEHGSSRINQIVGDLREFVRERGKGEPRWIDLKQIVEKGIFICQGRIRKTIKRFDTDLPDGLAPLRTDPLAVEQIVVNLLVNAIQAADKDDSWVKVTIRRERVPENEIVVEVSDNGCGMDDETQGKIFDPFFTTKEVGVGTGLGLSITHRLVTELGGRIEVASKVGVGSTFSIILKTVPNESFTLRIP